MTRCSYVTLLTPTDRAFKAKQQVVHYDVLVDEQSNKHGVVDIGLLRDAFREREEVDFSTYFPERNNRKEEGQALVQAYNDGEPQNCWRAGGAR